MIKLTPADLMLYSTVKLTTRSKGKTTGSGTGFFYRIDVDADHCANLLVTNKHVLEGADEVVLQLHVGTGKGEDGPTGEIVSCVVTIGPEGPLQHPDPNVDLAGLSLGELFEKALVAEKPIFYVSLHKSNQPSEAEWDNFDSIEEVIMIGCPNGLFDESNNIPIARRGITATPLGKKYNGENRFLVDMACFPGSSGSPIFLYDKNGYLDRKANTYMIGVQRVFFVGILFAGPTISNAGQIVMARTPRIEVATMMHLGFAIRSTELLALESALLSKLRQPAGRSA